MENDGLAIMEKMGLNFPYSIMPQMENDGRIGRKSSVVRHVCSICNCNETTYLIIHCGL
jgi:hypothetical protein